MPRGGKKQGGKKKGSKQYRDAQRAENIEEGKQEEEMKEAADEEAAERAAEVKEEAERQVAEARKLALEALARRNLEVKRAKVDRLREITGSGVISSVDNERIEDLYLKNPDCQGWPITLGQCLDDDSLMLNVFTPTRHKPDIHTFTEFGRRVVHSTFFQLALLHGSKKAHGHLTADRIIINFDADFRFKAVELQKDGEYVKGSVYKRRHDVYNVLEVLRMHRDKRDYKLADDVADFIEWGEALFHPNNPNQGWYQIVKAKDIPIVEANNRIAELNDRPIVKATFRSQINLLFNHPCLWQPQRARQNITDFYTYYRGCHPSTKAIIDAAVGLSEIDSLEKKLAKCSLGSNEVGWYTRIDLTLAQKLRPDGTPDRYARLHICPKMISFMHAVFYHGDTKAENESTPVELQTNERAVVIWEDLKVIGYDALINFMENTVAFEEAKSIWTFTP